MRLRGTLISLGVIAAAFAALAATLGLRPSLFSTAFAEGGVDVTQNYVYGPNPRHRLDIYRPRQPAPDSPVAIFYYGGGWRSGDRATYGFVGSALASLGVTVVIPDYRLYPEAAFPVFVEDGALAYAWVFKNLRSQCGGRAPVIIGHSAGAHIGALLALDRRYLKAQGDIAQPSAFIGLAGPYSFDPTTWPSTKDIFVKAASADDARPAAFASKAAPPMLLMHGLDDETVQLWNLRTLADALKAKGSPVETAEFESIGHIGIVLAISRLLRWRAPVLDKMADFIRRNASCPQKRN
ncbi:MAG: alpha/beta hydrolase [Hyphomicrobiales bacterium]|nr:alpha/beta hydrolase [Hyphomicrobiales bacterium]